jgi:hypothetical protein
MLVGGKDVKAERDLRPEHPGGDARAAAAAHGCDAGLRRWRAARPGRGGRHPGHGFCAMLDATIDNLPRERQSRERQTMLCLGHPEKARDLAHLSVRQPGYLAAHAEADALTPAKLQQAVMKYTQTGGQALMLLVFSGAGGMTAALLAPGIPTRALHMTRTRCRLFAAHSMASSTVHGFRSARTAWGCGRYFGDLCNASKPVKPVTGV